MYSKLGVFAALALASQAAADQHSYHHHEHHGHHHPSGIFPPSGSVAPFPTGASSGGVFPTGASSGGVFPTGASSGGVLPTGTAAGSGAGISSGSGPEPTGDSTLTYTIQVEGHTSVITTTIHHTKYHTDFVYAKESNAPAEKDVNQGSVTETLHITSTSTNFITAYASATNAPAAKEKVAAPATGAGGCAEPSTVTIQGPEITVTVTAPAAAGTGGAESNQSQTQGAGSEGAGSQSAGPEGASTEVPPYPIPSSKKSKTKCASTGFITKSVKPTGTGGQGTLPTGSGGLKHPFPVASGTAPIVNAKKLKK